MRKKVIIGAGFSAVMYKLLTKEKFKIIGTKNNFQLIAKNSFKRKSLVINKLFSFKSMSFGHLKFNLKKVRLHDRISFGGKSNIWGGNINIKKLPISFLKILNKKKISLKKLDIDLTGTVSNNKFIYQIQNKDNKIFDARNLSKDLTNGYLYKFRSIKKKIILEFLDYRNKKKKFFVNKLILGVGLVQLIDLLFRSGYLKDGDKISLFEFEHKFKFNFSQSRYNKDVFTTVRYSLSRALGHLLGIQYYSSFLKIFKYIPIVIDQNFYKKKRKCNFFLKNGIIKVSKTSSSNFGDSIHYCNMLINGEKIDKFLKKINKNIVCIGMASVEQKFPGPISNEIISDIYKKI